MGHSVMDDVTHVLISNDVIGFPATSHDRHQTRVS